VNVGGAGYISGDLDIVGIVRSLLGSGFCGLQFSLNGDFYFLSGEILVFLVAKFQMYIQEQIYNSPGSILIVSANRSSQNIERCEILIFFVVSYCQIWLIHLINDHHFR